MNLAGKIDSLWYGRAYRELLRDVLAKLGIRSMYDFIIIDAIPFYDRKYAILLLHAADVCIIPLRPSVIDVYRTARMLKELPKNSLPKRR